MDNAKQFEIVGSSNDEDLIKLIKSKEDILFEIKPCSQTQFLDQFADLIFTDHFAYCVYVLHDATDTRRGSRVMQFGKSRARLQNDEEEKTTFADVAGDDEVKEELEEVVELLKASQKVYGVRSENS